MRMASWADAIRDRSELFFPTISGTVWGTIDDPIVPQYQKVLLQI